MGNRRELQMHRSLWFSDPAQVIRLLSRFFQPFNLLSSEHDLSIRLLDQSGLSKIINDILAKGITIAIISTSSDADL